MILDFYDLDEEQPVVETGILVFLLIALLSVFFQVIVNKGGYEL
jgi:hypothetical protein